MKKIIAVVIFFLVIVGAGAPFMNGLMTEKLLRQLTLNYNNDVASYDLPLELVRYERRYLSSEVEWEMTLPSASKHIAPFTKIIYTHHLKHGILGVTATASLEKNKWFTDFVNDKFNGKNPLRITTQFRVFRDIKTRCTLDDFSIVIGDETIAIKSGEIVAFYDTKIENISGKWSWKGAFTDETIQLDNISGSYNAKKISPHLWLGNSFWTAKNITFKNNDQHIVATRLKNKTALDIDKDRNLLFTSSLGANSVIFNQKKIDRPNIQIDVNNLDAERIEEICTLYYKMTQRYLQKKAPSETSNQMVGLFEKLLKKGLQLKISDLYAGLAEGEVKGAMDLSLKKDMTFAQFSPIAEQPSLIFDILSFESQLRLPAEICSNCQFLLTPLHPAMQTGIFVLDDGKMVHEAEIKENKILLNNKEINLNWR